MTEPQNESGNADTEGVEEPKFRAKWKYMTDFPINHQMKDAVEKTIHVTQMEISAMRRKIERLRYGM